MASPSLTAPKKVLINQGRVIVGHFFTPAQIHPLATTTVVFFWLPQPITWLTHSRQARC